MPNISDDRDFLQNQNFQFKVIYLDFHPNNACNTSLKCFNFYILFFDDLILSFCKNFYTLAKKENIFSHLIKIYFDYFVTKKTVTNNVKYFQNSFKILFFIKKIA